MPSLSSGRDFFATLARCALIASTACTTDRRDAGIAAPPQAALTGTLWGWQETLMSDDERIRPDAPERYTVELLPDGRLQVRADCNRGGGRYEAGADGRIELGAVATTAAMCPPGSRDAAFLKGLDNVGSYQVACADELWLMLEADSGTMRLRPVARP